MSEVSASFAIDLEKLKNLGINDPGSTAAIDLIRSKSLSSDQRLFLSLWRSTLLKTVLFEPKKKIISAGSLVEDGYLIISGSLVGVRGEHVYYRDCGASALDPFPQNRHHDFLAAKRDESYFANHYQTHFGFILILPLSRAHL